MSRQVEIADNGVMLIGVDDVSGSNDAALTDAARPSQPAAAEVFSGGKPRHTQFCRGGSGVEIDVVRS